jgi:DnaJ-class molecular chaperone
MNDHGFSKACPSGNHMLSMSEPEPQWCQACRGTGIEYDDNNKKKDCSWCEGYGTL